VISFIAGAFGGALDWIRHGAETVKNVFLSVWHTVENLGTNVWHAWTTAYHGIVSIVTGLEHLALETFRTVWWFLTKHLPDVISHVFDKVGNLLAHLFDVVKGWVSDFVQAVKAGIVLIINAVKAWAADIFAWVRATLSDVWNLLHKTADLVFSLLGDLDHLVTAITGRMAKALFRYFEDHAEAFAAWAIRHMVSASLGIADWIENIVADLL
jgi:phage-related protein